jgi:hypothetical protein
MYKRNMVISMHFWAAFPAIRCKPTVFANGLAHVPSGFIFRWSSGLFTTIGAAGRHLTEQCTLIN